LICAFQVKLIFIQETLWIQTLHAICSIYFAMLHLDVNDVKSLICKIPQSVSGVT